MGDILHACCELVCKTDESSGAVDRVPIIRKIDVIVQAPPTSNNINMLSLILRCKNEHKKPRSRCEPN